MTATIAAVIPTRNRAELAMSAVRSLLEQDCPIEIFLSDNSDSPDLLCELAHGEPRVHYLRPERELHQTEHWDWAVRQAMERSSATHFTIHYDRKYSKPHHWGGMAAVAAQWPELLVTYASDTVTNEPPPLRLWQTPWSGRTFMVQTARVAALAAAGRIRDAGHAMPVLTNCIVPRAILHSIVERFGSVCYSTSGDACFNARFLALHDQFLHDDRSIAITYAPHRSAGLGYLAGDGRDFQHWEKMWRGLPWLEAGIVPGLNLGQNMYFHEYELVRRETGDRLPPLDRRGCLNELGEALQWVRDPAKRAALRGRLEGHGWSGEVPALPKRPRLAALRDKALTFLIEHFGLIPSSVSGFAFPDDDTALQYALKYPQRPAKDHRHLAVLEPVAVP
jgi:hypothetical protein